MQRDTLDQLYQDWRTLKAARESVQDEIDRAILAHLDGQGPPPSRKQMDTCDDMLFQESEARGKIDAFIAEYAA